MSALKTLSILACIAVTTFPVSTHAQPSEASALSALPIGVPSPGPVATAKALDASSATVLVLACAGQDLSACRLTYSHMGFAYRKPAGRVEDAARLQGWANELARRRGDTRGVVYGLMRKALAAHLDASLAADAVRSALAAGVALNEAQALALA